MTDGEKSKELEIDLDAFEIQIDKEIDSLFVESSAETASLRGEAPDEVVSAAQVDLTAFEARVDMEIDSLFIPFDSPPEAVAPPAPERAAPSPGTASMPEDMSGTQAGRRERRPKERDGSAALLEDMSIAYLSLDWEFSLENVAGLEASLEKLEPYCRRLRETDVLYKVLRTVLKTLRVQPEAMDGRLLEFVREAQTLLKLLLLSEGKPGAYEKDRLSGLLDRLKSFKKAVPACRESTAVPRETSLERIGEEIARLGQLGRTLAKTPALAPVTSRIAKICSNLETHLAMLVEGEKQFAQGIAPPPATKEIPKVEISTREESKAEISTEVVSKEKIPSTETGDRRIGDVYLFAVGGRRLAVPAGNVVKFERAPGWKMKRILGRGYSTLLDFKPLFRSIRSGLAGNWKTLPADTLKGYRFDLMVHDALPDPDPHGKTRGVLLVSNGKNHGMIALEQTAAELHPAAAIAVGGQPREGVLGTIEVEADLFVDVVDLDRLLSGGSTGGRR